jgi:hypothetical protein
MAEDSLLVEAKVREVMQRTTLEVEGSYRPHLPGSALNRKLTPTGVNQLFKALADHGITFASKP